MMLLHLDPPIEGGASAPRPECANPYNLAPEATVSREEIDRYFDRGARSVQSTLDAVKQVTAQARQVSVPRPDATLAAIAAAAAGR